MLKKFILLLLILKQPKKEMNDFLILFENLLQIELPDKTSISNTAWRSRWASKIITLHPIPFDISTSLICGEPAFRTSLLHSFVFRN